MEEAAKQIKSGDVVASGLGIGACSTDMYQSILDRHEELRDVWIVDAVQVRPSKLYDPQFMASIDGRINYMPGFGMITIRKIHSTLQPDFLPITSSDSGEKIGKVSDVFMCMVTPPNRQGYVNLGLTNFYSMQAIREGRASGKQRVTIGEVMIRCRPSSVTTGCMSRNSTILWSIRHRCPPSVEPNREIWKRKLRGMCSS